MTDPKSIPGGKTANATTHGDNYPRRRGHEWSSGAWKHKPQKREGISMETKARWLAIAALAGLAIALPNPF